MVARLLAALLFFLLPSFAWAQAAAPAAPTFAERWAAATPAAASTLAGSWALRLDGAIVMRFDLEPDGDSWKGGWAKPSSFATDGERFGRIAMPAIERKSDRGAALGDWAEIAFTDPRPDKAPDVFRFHLVAPDRAEMIYVGTGLAPYVLERVAPGALLGPFEDGRVYGSGQAAAPAAPGPRLPALPAPTPRNLPPLQGPPATGGR